MKMVYGRSKIFNRRRIMQGNRFLIIFIIMLLLIVTGGCGFIAWRDGPYKGRVIDAETGKPLEGVVVLGVWYKELPSPGGTVGSYFDAQETVTNKNGDFEVKGLGLQIFSTVSKMHVLIFKAGYEHIGSGLWGSLNLDGGLMKKKVAWEEAPLGKLRLMLKEINKEAMERGLKPIDIWRGEKVKVWEN
jgi:hypothetical protein